MIEREKLLEEFSLREAKRQIMLAIFLGVTVIAKLTNPYQNRVDIAKSLFGILPADITLEDATDGLDCRKAISSDIADYEDAVMVETAIRCEIDCIVTHNSKDYSKSPIAVYEPTDFISKVTA